MPGLVYGWEFNSIGTISALLFMAIVLAAQEDIVHTLQNFLNHGELWRVYNPEYNASWVMTAALPLWILMIVLEIVRWRRGKRESIV